MHELLVVLPILIPFFFGIIMVIFWKKTDYHKAINFIGSIVLLAASIALLASIYNDGIKAVTMGSWMAPFGITIVADLFSAIMVVISGVMCFATAMFSISTIDTRRAKHFYYPLLQILIMGINGSFLTGDIFNLYVWFEVMLISSFVLLALGGREEQLEGAIKYVTLNLLSSAIFLAGVGILYGTVGTLNMADLAMKLPLINNEGMIIVLSMMFLIAFGIKSAIFPLFFWLPASYHTPPAAVSAIFAGLLTKVGVYALYRVFTLIFNPIIFSGENSLVASLIVIISGFTMITGVLGAASQNNFRRILSFHIISQIGYMTLGLGLGLLTGLDASALAMAGGIFYIIHHIVVKTNLFLIAGIVNKIKGSYELKQLGGVYRLFPLLGFLFLIPAMSLAGIPPLSGFWSKFLIVKAGLGLAEYVIIAVSLLVGLLTLFSMIKIWNECFWKDSPDKENKISDEYKNMSFGRKFFLFAPVILLATITVIIGLNIEPFFQIAERAAEQLLNPSIYINAVLGNN